jgi:hypothetical protein
MIYAAAMAFDCSPEDIIKRLGHDGTEVAFPEQEGQKQLRGIHIQELIDVAYDLGIILLQVELFPTIAPNRESAPKIIWDRSVCSRRFVGYLQSRDALIYCKRGSSSPEHMVAWNSTEQKIYDPHGFIKPLADYVIGAAWLVVRL